MPAELRHIVFRPVEVVKAVIEYRRRMRRPLPAGHLRSYQLREPSATDDAVSAIFEISPDTTSEPQIVELAGPELAASLILFCIDRKIPLPASANKSLKKFGDHLTLIVTLNPKQEEEPFPEIS
ncbi:MAG: hypothetical protein JO267_07215 [Alphaproteobacteria bacterium]|nr:hypothetical protein [Alphaproteobacteria bacterium]